MRHPKRWIKLHSRLLSNSKWLKLSSTDKGIIIMLWLIATEHDKDGQLPDLKTLSKYQCLGHRLFQHPTRIDLLLRSFVEQNLLEYDQLTNKYSIHDYDYWQADIRLKTNQICYTTINETPLDKCSVKCPEKSPAPMLQTKDLQVNKSLVRDVILENTHFVRIFPDNFSEGTKNLSGCYTGETHTERLIFDAPGDATHHKRSTGAQNTSALQAFDRKINGLSHSINKEAQDMDSIDRDALLLGDLIDCMDDNVNAMHNQSDLLSKQSSTPGSLPAAGSISGVQKSTPSENISPKIENQGDAKKIVPPVLPAKLERSEVFFNNATPSTPPEKQIVSRGNLKEVELPLFNETVKAKKTRRKQVEGDYRYEELKSSIEQMYHELRGYSLSVWAGKGDWVQFARMLRKTRNEPYFSVERLKRSFYKFLVEMPDFPMRVWCTHPERWFEDRKVMSRENMRMAIEEKKREESRLETLKLCAVHAPECLTDEEVKELERIGFDLEAEKIKYSHSVH